MSATNSQKNDAKTINEENRYFGEVVGRLLNTPPQPKVADKKPTKPHNK